MKKAFRVIWWTSEKNEDLDVIVVTDKIDDVVALFKKEYPDYDPNNISNIEVMTSKVILG